MSLKTILLGLFFLISLLAPPVFAGLVLVGVVTAVICHLDIALEKFGREVAENCQSNLAGTDAPNTPLIKIPCNFFAVGMLLSIAFTILGISWGMNPDVAAGAVESFLMCAWIVVQFGALMIFIASMYRLIKLVD